MTYPTQTRHLLAVVPAKSVRTWQNHLAHNISSIANDEWSLAPAEQATLIRVVAMASAATRALRSATKRADKLFGVKPKKS